jgi:hypothetical protein
VRLTNRNTHRVEVAGSFGHNAIVLGATLLGGENRDGGNRELPRTSLAIYRELTQVAQVGGSGRSCLIPQSAGSTLKSLDEPSRQAPARAR